MASLAVCFFRAPSWFGVPENDPIEVMSDPPIYADALQAPRERASTLRTPACLVQLSFGRISKAEVIRAVDRKRFGYVGDLTDDCEIVLLRLLIYCSIAVKVPIKSSYMRVTEDRSTRENFTWAAMVASRSW